MRCTDCEEPVIESERRTLIICKGCRQVMHAECAMSSASADDFCETCFYDDQKNWRRHMMGDPGAVA